MATTTTTRKSVKRKERGSELERLVERDLTAMARAGTLPAVHFTDSAPAEVVALLEQGQKAPFLAGEAGVGKSAIVLELARRIAEGRVAESLVGGRVLEVPLAGVFARTANPKQSAELFEQLLDWLAEQPATLLYLRDASMLEGSSLVPVLVRALRAGRLRFVFESELRAAQALLRSDESIAERAHLIVIAEPSPEHARWILGKVAGELEARHGLAIDPAACDLALRLSSRFLLSRRLPRKALELLKEASAEAAGQARDRVGPEDVLRRFCSATRLPNFVVDDALPLDLAETERFFGDRILGQPEAVSAVLRSVALLKAGLNDPRRPLGGFLFAGPTGVGKTHLAKLLAEFLFGSADRLVRLNMADYPDDGDELTVFGSPWGQTVDAKRGELTRLLEGKVFAVLLLDEFEKAARACHDRFLQLLDEGQFINAAGELVPCSNVLIVATSNVGAEVYREPPIGFAGTRSQADQLAEVDRRIAGSFRPEFLNRFDAVCHFLPLGRVEIRKIAQREVGRVIAREGIRERRLDVEVAPDVVDLLVERGYSPSFGARFLQREIEKSLTSALAVEIARQPLPPGTRVSVVTKPGPRIVAVVGERPSSAPTTTLAIGRGAMAGARRKLDRGALIDEAREVLRRGRALDARSGRSALEARRQTHLARSQAPDFWDDPEAAAATLRDFRSMEAALADLARILHACTVAERRAQEARSEPQLAVAAKLLEEAATEVRLAEARLAAGTDSAVDEAVVEISSTSEGSAAEAWVFELARMYLQWAERRGYEVQAVAEGTGPARAVLRVEGPGVLGFLAGEAGMHRRIDGESRIAALVRVLAPGSAPDGRLAIQGRETRRRAGVVVERITAELRARDEASGREATLAGEEVEGLEQLAAILLGAPSGPTAEARRYHLGKGARVEDPRTNTGTPRWKDVLRGELEPFIAAWLERPPEAEAPRHHAPN